MIKINQPLSKNEYQCLFLLWSFICGFSSCIFSDWYIWQQIYKIWHCRSRSLFYYLLDVKMCQILKHVRCSLRSTLLLHSPSSPSPCSTLHFSGKTLSRCEGHVPVVQVLKYGLQWSRHKVCWTWYFQKRHYINKNNVLSLDT